MIVLSAAFIGTRTKKRTLGSAESNKNADISIGGSAHQSVRTYVPIHASSSGGSNFERFAAAVTVLRMYCLTTMKKMYNLFKSTLL